MHLTFSRRILPIPTNTRSMQDIEALEMLIVVDSKHFFRSMTFVIDLEAKGLSSFSQFHGNTRVAVTWEGEILKKQQSLARFVLCIHFFGPIE